MPSDQDWIDAYLRERAAAGRAGQTVRVAAIDAELRRLGYSAERVGDGGPVGATEPPRRRRTPPRDST